MLVVDFWFKDSDRRVMYRLLIDGYYFKASDRTVMYRLVINKLCCVKGF